MNRLVKRLINLTPQKILILPNGDPNVASKYLIAKRIYKAKTAVVHNVKEILKMTIGVVTAGFGLRGFLLPNNFIDGGVTGISLLIHNLTEIELPYLLVIINIPFMILGYFQISPNFAYKSILSIVGLALAITLIPYPVITSDKLLIAAFGGLFLGAGIGFAVRGGAVLDGTEVLAIYLSRKIGATIGDIILVFNIGIFSIAAYLLSIEIALYAILTYFSAARTIDFIIEGIEEYTGVTIVSSHSTEIQLMIRNVMGRGYTILNGRRGHGKQGTVKDDTEIIYSVITRLEVAKLEKEVNKLDPNAFIVKTSLKDIRGGMVKKRPLH
ncbi:MAG: YitT family protein [Saprospiraceae bacterium]